MSSEFVKTRLNETIASPEFPRPLRLIITQIYMSARKYTSNKYENACNFVQRQTRAKTKKKQANESSYLVHLDTL